MANELFNSGAIAGATVEALSEDSVIEDMLIGFSPEEMVDSLDGSPAKQQKVLDYLDKKGIAHKFGTPVYREDGSLDYYEQEVPFESSLTQPDSVLGGGGTSVLEDTSLAVEEDKNLPHSKNELTRRAIASALALGTDEDELDSDAAMAAEEIASAGDGSIRAAVGQRVFNSRLEALQALENNGETNREVLEESIALLYQARNDRDEYKLEKLAVENALAFAERNPGFADLRILNAPLMETIAKRQQAEQIVQTFLANKRITEKGEGFFGYFLDGLGEIALELVGDNLISFLRTYGLTPSSLFQASEAILNLDPKEIPGALDAFYSELERKSSVIATTQRRALSNLEMAFEGTGAGLSSEASWAALEALLFVPYTAIAKGGAGLLKGTGNASRAARDVTRALDNGTVEGSIIDTAEDLVRESTLFRPVTPDYSGLPDAVTRELENVEMAIQQLKDSSQMRRLTPEELQTAVEARKSQLAKLHGSERMNAGTVNWNQETGLFELDVYFGKVDGAGFASKKSAENWLSRSSIEGKVVETENGWMVRQTQPVAEALADKGFANWRPINIARRVLGGSKSFVDEFLGQHGTAASHMDTRSSAVVRQLYKNNIDSLPKKEFNEVNEVLNSFLGREGSDWLTPDEFSSEVLTRFGKEASERQITAYETFRQISDYAYYLDNKSIYKEKTLKGLERISLSNYGVEPFEGKIFTQMSEIKKVPGRERVFNERTGEIGKLTTEQLEDAFNNGYVLIRPSETEWTIEHFGEGASYLLVKRNNDLKISPIDYHQLNYVPGGRRDYRAPFFIGQQTSGQFADGTRYRAKPRIFRTATTEKEAIKWVENANVANRALAQVEDGTLTAAEASALIESRTGKTYSEWKQMAEADGWNIREDFNFKRDRQDFPTDWEGQDAIRMYDPEAYASQFGTSRSNRLGHRGEWLKDVNGDESQVFDAFSSLRRNVDKAINAGMYSDFKATAINRFNTTFRKYIKDAEHLTPYEVVTKGIVDERLLSEGVVNGVDMAKVYNAVKAHQFYINSMLRVQGKWDLAVGNAMNKLAKWIDKGELGHKASAVLSRSQGDPISFMRNLNFDLNMSLFNPAQFLMQANSVLIAGAMSPKYGMAAFKDSVPLRMALISGDPTTTRGIGKHFKGLTDGTDIEKAADQFRRLGFNDFGANLAMIDAQGSLGATSNRLMSKVNRFRENSRFFFQEGERYSRMTAYGIARRKYAEKFPGKDAFGKSADNWIREETDRLLLSPNADNNALLNKGLGGIPTQFWSYMMKVSDMTFTGAGGRYTGRERAQVALAQVLFYGAAGLPFLDYMVNQFETSTGTVLDPTMAKAIHNGLIDTLIFTATGGEVDTDFSGISGLGGWWQSLAEDLAENPITSLLGGATGTNLSNSFKVMAHTARIYGLSHNPSFEGVTMTALAGLGSSVKSLDKATKAWLAYNTGIWYDKYGRAITDVTSGEAIASLFGLPPQAVADTYKLSADQKAANQKYVKDVAPVIQAMHMRYNNAETDEEREAIAEQMNAMWAIVYQSGYTNEVVGTLNQYRRSPEFKKSLQRFGEREYLQNKAGHNPNLFSQEFRRQLIEQKESK